MLIINYIIKYALVCIYIYNLNIDKAKFKMLPLLSFFFTQGILDLSFHRSLNKKNTVNSYKVKYVFLRFLFFRNTILYKSINLQNLHKNKTGKFSFLLK